MNTHIQVANCRFGKCELPHFHWVAQVALPTEVASVQVSAVCDGRVEVRSFLCASSLTAHSLWCHFDKEGIRLSGFDEA